MQKETMLLANHDKDNSMTWYKKLILKNQHVTE